MFIRFSEVPENVPYYIHHCDPEDARDGITGLLAIRQGHKIRTIRKANNAQGWEVSDTLNWCPASHWTALRRAFREDGDD